MTALGLVSALRALPHLAHLELGVMPWANGVVKLGDSLYFERLTSLRSVHFQYGLGPVRDEHIQQENYQSALDVDREGRLLF